MLRISGFVWGAHRESQVQELRKSTTWGLLHESTVIDWELPCINDLM